MQRVQCAALVLSRDKRLYQCSQVLKGLYQSVSDRVLGLLGGMAMVFGIM